MATTRRTFVRTVAGAAAGWALGLGGVGAAIAQGSHARRPGGPARVRGRGAVAPGTVVAAGPEDAVHRGGGHAVERRGGPIELGAWRYGDTSAATDAVVMFRGNPAHRFYGTGPVPQRPRVVWRQRLEDLHTTTYGEPRVWRGTGWTGQAVALGGHVFVASQGGNVYAFDADTGRIRWRLPGRRMFKASACLYRNRLYVGNTDNRLRCIDARTGDVLWWVDTGADLDSSAAVWEGRLYVAGESGFMRCLDPETGETLWKTFVGGVWDGPHPGSYGAETSPAVDGGQCWCGTYDGVLWCLDARDGRPVWKARTGDDTDASPVVWRDRVFVGAEDRSPYLWCFGRHDGKPLWRLRARGGVWATPAVTDDGVVFVGSAGGRFYAVDALRGTLRWEINLKALTWSSPCVVDGRVIFGAVDGALYCLEAATGKRCWRLPLRGRIHATPCIVGGRIYVGTAEGWFYAIA